MARIALSCGTSKPPPGTVDTHAVENDLAGTARLHLAHPVRHRASSIARAPRIAAEEPGPIPRRGAQTVDAHHDALGSQNAGSDPR